MKTILRLLISALLFVGLSVPMAGFADANTSVTTPAKVPATVVKPSAVKGEVKQVPVPSKGGVTNTHKAQKVELFTNELLK